MTDLFLWRCALVANALSPHWSTVAAAIPIVPLPLKHGWVSVAQIDPSPFLDDDRKVHEGAVIVQVLDDGAIRFTQPNGKSFDSVAPGCTQPLSDWTQIPAEHDECGIHIDERTAATKWAGESMDYGLGVQVLLQQTRKHRDGPARVI